MAEALIQIVDEDDTPIRAATKQEAWEHGLIHRIARIMVEDEQGKVLLQKRAASKKLYPNRWDNSAAGHVDEGEDYEAAARRELQEELGIEGADLQEIDSYRVDKIFEGRKLNRFNKVFKAVVDSSVSIKVQEKEVAEVRWFTHEELKVLAKEQPDSLTDGLSYALEHYYSVRGMRK